MTRCFDDGGCWILDASRRSWQPLVRYPPPVVLHLKDDGVPRLGIVNLQATTILSSEDCWEPELACFTALQSQIVGARGEALRIHRLINATDAVGVLG